MMNKYLEKSKKYFKPALVRNATPFCPQPSGTFGAPPEPQIWAFNTILAVIALPWNSMVDQHSQSDNWSFLSQPIHFCLSDRGDILVRGSKNPAVKCEHSSLQKKKKANFTELHLEWTHSSRQACRSEFKMNTLHAS